MTNPRAAVRSAARILAVVAAIASGAGCDRASSIDLRDRLSPCPPERGLGDALCGSLRVLEDRARPDGRTIELSIVVLPAHADGRPEPVFFLAGGPGQGAATLAPRLAPMLAGLQRDRDVVLVDQRGTGASGVLACDDGSDPVATLLEPEEASLARLERCREGYEADVRQYTTPIAMDDLDEVRAHLGYERIHLYGVSYGTRAALVYLEQHGDRVASLVLDGVAPTSMGLPRTLGRDGQRALDALVADCDRDPRCREKHPRLGARIEEIVRALDRAPKHVRLVHPRTAEHLEVRVDARVFVHVLFAALYAPLVGSLLPEIVEDVERGSFESLFALALLNAGAGGDLAAGMQLAVVCSEDATAPTRGDAAPATSPVFGDRLLSTLTKACERWPKGTLPAGYHDPVTSAVPALVLSGELDPVTPASFGEEVAAHLSRSRHVVLAGNGHGSLGTACGRRLVRDFLARGDAASVDASCAELGRRPPFFAGPSGPDPTGGHPGGAP
jgi:pimeloyl-ACP methyl ester carboxylesterase